jgi:hypothetical protein
MKGARSCELLEHKRLARTRCINDHNAGTVRNEPPERGGISRGHNRRIDSAALVVGNQLCCPLSDHLVGDDELRLEVAASYDTLTPRRSAQVQKNVDSLWNHREGCAGKCRREVEAIGVA